MNRWVYWVSLAFILIVVGFPLYRLVTDPQGDVRDLFKLGIDLEGGTSLIYEMRAPEGAGGAIDARHAKQVITGRIDPQGTRGYTVRAIGQRRLEIILPGRQTRVRVESEPPTQENLAAVRQAATRQSKLVADLLETKADAFLSGLRLPVRMKPPLYLDDITNRLTQAVRERFPAERPTVAVVGVDQDKEQWESVVVLVAAPVPQKDALGEWRDLVTTALATQQDVTRVKRLVRQAGFLEFRILADKVKDRDKADLFERLVRLKQGGQAPDTPQYRWYPLKKGWEWYQGGMLDAWNFIYVVDKESQTVEALVDIGDGQDVTGQDLSGAGGSTQDAAPIVVFSLKAQAGARFARLTRPEMRDRQMAIILDGVVQSAPALRATLSTGGIIEGYRGNLRERDEVVTILNSGQLAASLGDPITERTVGPELGADNIQNGFRASVIGFALVFLFILVYYRFAGLVANIALLLNLVLIVCIMFLIRQAWTLPGIAGLILSLAMAVDANVLIYERLREEKGKEGSLGFALKKAYERAFRTIFDANVTTLIPAFILLLPNLVTEEVKGFAVVIIIGILVSMFTAVVVTRMIFETLMRWGLLKDIKMFQLFTAPNINWMRFVRPAVVISGGAMALGAILFFSRGEEKYDIEFTGGTQVELAVQAPAGQGAVGIEEVRARVGRAVGAGATVQELVYAHDTAGEEVERYLISVPAAGSMAAGEAPVKDALAGAFADLRPTLGVTRARVEASEITEQVIRRRLEADRAAPKPVAPDAAAPAAPAAPAEAPQTEYIPPELRQYLGKVRVLVDVSPAMGPGEVRRRIDAFIRDRYPDLVGTLYEVAGRTPGQAMGEFESFDVWVRQDFAGARGEVAAPALWGDVVKLALGSEETFASTTSFEPTMAGETWDKAVIAILFSLAAMIFYISIRFARLSSGVAAVVALIHDVVLTLGAVSLAAILADSVLGVPLMLADFKINLPMVGAFLTLVGYSVNDTIVVFDRIRENRGKYGDMSVAIVNSSINQTVSRTVLTSVTVFLAVAALYIFAGRSSSVHGLSFVMLFGTVVGTYSSIAIASPILVLRDYLYRLYVWVYPLLVVGLLGYFGFVWETPAVFFGAWQGWAWTVGTLAWLAVAWWIVSYDVRGEPWPPAAGSPGLVQALAAFSMLAPIGTAALIIAMIMTPGTSITPWAGPAAMGTLATIPVTYALVRMAWGEKAGRHQKS